MITLIAYLLLAALAASLAYITHAGIIAGLRDAQPTNQPANQPTSQPTGATRCKLSTTTICHLAGCRRSSER